jgi:integrase
MLKFKKVLNRAFEDKISPINSAVFKFKFKLDSNAIKKPMLDPDEIQKLIKAECLNDHVRRAYLLSLNTGFDFATVNALYGWMVDKDRLIFDRSKTDTQNSFPLNKTALALIGKIEDPEAKIFNLPTWRGCVESVRAWAKRAGIHKKLTCHSARHSFATNLSSDYNVDVMVIKELLGHKDVRTTQRYLKVKDKNKRAAVEKLPDMDLNTSTNPGK